ncbi:MAG: hypothetical protein AAGM22_15990 [Acidobacteriota bacterium]
MELTVGPVLANEHELEDSPQGLPDGRRDDGVNDENGGGDAPS